MSEKTSFLDARVREIAPNFMTADEILNEMPVWPLAINVFSACFCMGCSAIYHTVLCKSQECQTNMSRLDYGGISILVFGSCVPVLYYAMACEQVRGKRFLLHEDIEF